MHHEIKGGVRAFWNTALHDKLSVHELFRLQGINVETLQDLTLTDKLLGELVGNSFTQTVIEQILISLLVGTGLASRADLCDRFK